MSRIRLTQRMAGRDRLAEERTPESPIDLGKNRTYRKIDQYHTFEPEKNHWIPDMDHEWKRDQIEREPTNHGKLRNEQVFTAAKKATKLAMMFLGTNASDADIEYQARAFMRMGDRAMTASIERWAQTKQDGESTCAGDAPCAAIAGDKEEAATPAAPAEVAPAAPAEGEKPAEKCTCGEPGCPECNPPKAVEPTDASINLVKSSEGESAGDAVQTTETVDKDTLTIPDTKNQDIEFDGASVDEDKKDEKKENPDDKNQLDEIGWFGDNGDGKQEELEKTPAPSSTTASKKEGVKKLCGQPTLSRVASVKSDDLTSLWDKWSDPTVIR